MSTTPPPPPSLVPALTARWVGDHNDAATVRTLANLLLAPASVRRATDYWLRTYVPLMIETRAVIPKTLTAPACMVALLQRMLATPTDVVVVSQGGIAITADATRAHWLHTLNFMSPVDDFSLCLPLQQYKGCALHLCMLQHFAEPESYWAEHEATAMQGQLRFASFARPEWLGLFYRPSLFIGLALYDFATAIMLTPKLRGSDEYAGLGMLRDIVAQGLADHVLGQRQQRPHPLPPSERVTLLALRNAVLSAADLTGAFHALEALVVTLLNAADADYARLRVLFDAPFAPEEWGRLPWHAHCPPLELDAANDAMDIDA